MALQLLCSIVYDCQLLPFFLRYYSSKGVTRFVFAVWDREHGSLWKQVKTMCLHFDVILIEQIDTTFNGENDAKIHNWLRKIYVEDGAWYVICDLDEFHELGGYNSYNDAIIDAENHGASAIRGMLVDRVAIDGSIPAKLDMNRSLGGQFPIVCNITGSILNANRSKVMIAQKRIAISPGHHRCKKKGVYWGRKGRVHHFKWFGNLKAETFKRMVSYEKQDLYYKNEPNILYNFILQFGNRIPIDESFLNARALKVDPLASQMGFDR